MNLRHMFERKPSPDFLPRPDQAMVIEGARILGRLPPSDWEAVDALLAVKAHQNPSWWKLFWPGINAIIMREREALLAAAASRPSKANP